LETFNRKNIRCGIEQSLRRIAPVVERARAGLPVRAYLFRVLGCPYEGPISPEWMAPLAGRLHELGCEEIALADTIGAGTSLAACRVVEATALRVRLGRIAVHLHDTRCQAFVNILACLGLGVSIIDAAVVGLGGSPYVPERPASRPRTTSPICPGPRLTRPRAPTADSVASQSVSNQ
jgi:hydroxymethylglutaryl-CoA lyase